MLESFKGDGSIYLPALSPKSFFLIAPKKNYLIQECVQHDAWIGLEDVQCCMHGKSGESRRSVVHHGYGTASVWICITRLQLYPNAVCPGQRITKLGSDCQTGQCWSNIAQDSVAALLISHLKCQKHTLVRCLAVNPFETWPPCWNRKHLPTRSMSIRWTWRPW